MTTTAVIALQGTATTRYWTVANGGDPERMIPMLAFMHRFGRLHVCLPRAGAWILLHPQPETSSGVDAIRGFGSYDASVLRPRQLVSGEQLQEFGDEVYLLDADRPDVVTYCGREYPLLSPTKWEEGDYRSRYNHFFWEYGY